MYTHIYIMTSFVSYMTSFVIYDVIYIRYDAVTVCFSTPVSHYCVRFGVISQGVCASQHGNRKGVAEMHASRQEVIIRFYCNVCLSDSSRSRGAELLLQDKPLHPVHALEHSMPFFLHVHLRLSQFPLHWQRMTFKR